MILIYLAWRKITKTSKKQTKNVSAAEIFTHIFLHRRRRRRGFQGNTTVGRAGDFQYLGRRGVPHRGKAHAVIILLAVGRVVMLTHHFPVTARL